MNPRHLNLPFLKGHVFQYLPSFDKLVDDVHHPVYGDPRLDEAVKDPVRPSLRSYAADLFPAYGVQLADLAVPNVLVPGECILKRPRTRVGIGL